MTSKQRQLEQARARLARIRHHVIRLYEELEMKYQGEPDAVVAGHEALMEAHGQLVEALGRAERRLERLMGIVSFDEMRKESRRPSFDMGARDGIQCSPEDRQ